MYIGPTRLSFIVPTTGRDSLRDALASIAAQPLLEQDEVILVGDIIRKDLFPAQRLNLYPIHINEPGHDWGATERRIAMRYATGTHLVFLDDDDALFPGAVTVIRNAADKYPLRPLMFKMVERNGHVLWMTPEVKCGNHSSTQFVPPNDARKLGEWTTRYEGDFDFCTSTLAKYPPNSLVWDTSIIAGSREFGNINYLCKALSRGRD